jgi:hypothetical protein
MNRYVATEAPGYFRDTATGAIINRNITELNQLHSERAKMAQQENINKKVEELSTSISEIKEILKILVKNNNGN